VNSRTALGASAASSFYVLSKARVLAQTQHWKRALPNVKPFYAVKCNPDPTLMTWLRNEGSGFDCASQREIDAVRNLPAIEGATTEILFANPCKNKKELGAALAADVSVTVVDSEEEVHKLRNAGWTGSAFLRLRVADTGSKMPFSAKFGLAFEEVERLAWAARDQRLPITGVSFHVGSGCESPEQYTDAIEQADAALATLQRAGHTNARTIDIGGGFVPDGFDAAAQAIRTAAGRLHTGKELVAEPGRFFAQTSHDLFVQVIGKKPGPRGGFRYTLDESLYGQFSCIPYDHAQPRWIRVRAAGEKRRREVPAVLYGRTCDSVDFIASAAQAEELEEGDWLWFPHMGAYTTVTSTEFNGFPKPKMLVLEGECGAEVALPDPRNFRATAWPQGCEYVSAVKVPEIK
jgi:ornithine decarboxylase